MCVILICKTAKPEADVLARCSLANPDGCGIAWFKDNSTYYKKGMSLVELNNFISVLELPFVIHFRAASCGGKDMFLTHPFPITLESELALQGNASKLLFHNGHVKDYELLLSCCDIETQSNELMSDTRAIAKILAKNNNTNFLSKLNGKWVVMDSENNNIITYGNFEKEYNNLGIEFSNTGWKTQKLESEKKQVSYYSYRATRIKKSSTDKSACKDPHKLLTDEEMVTLDKPARRALREQRRKERGLPEPTTHPNAHLSGNVTPYIISPEPPKNCDNNTRKILGLPPIESEEKKSEEKLFPWQPDLKSRPYLPPGCPSLGLPPDRKLIGYNR
jgi:predicted glutamine amidotransferase